MNEQQDVEIIARETPFQGFFRIDRYRLRHRLFGGGMSAELRREIFERGQAVGLLPYDPVGDQVVLIEQFRIGAYAAGRNPWLVEIVAGIIEDDQASEDVARREMTEETGLEIVGNLIPVADYLVTPGGSSETVKIYCARVDARAAGGIHGCADEGEDIRVFAIPVEEAFRRLGDGQINNSPAIIALQWLALNHRRIRQTLLDKSTF